MYYFILISLSSIIITGILYYRTVKYKPKVEYDVNRPLFIGILGKKGAGKDTIGTYLINKYGYTSDAFAEPLKQVCKITFSLSDRQLYGSLAKKETIDERWGKSPRQMFQEIGTLLRQTISDDIWIRNLFYRIRNKKYVVVTDCRCQAEVDMLIKKFNCVIIKVHRDTKLNDAHISETGVDLVENYDYEINNNGTINDLYEKIDIIINKLIIKNAITANN